MNNAIECLDFLIESGANTSILNSEMNGPIHVAVIMNQVGILKEMVKNKDKVNVMLRGKHGRSALHFAAIKDHDECVRILVSKGKRMYFTILTKNFAYFLASKLSMLSKDTLSQWLIRHTRGRKECFCEST